jgi:hypothetical protein
VSEAVSRLSRSRLAIIEHIEHTSQQRGRAEPAGRFARLGKAATGWWRYHPAHLVLDLATPVVSRCAGRHPWWFLALAAASGALVDRVRPWRLLSLSALITVAKSTQLASLVLPAISALRRPPR